LNAVGCRSFGDLDHQTRGLHLRALHKVIQHGKKADVDEVRSRHVDAEAEASTVDECLRKGAQGALHDHPRDLRNKSVLLGVPNRIHVIVVADTWAGQGASL
jgi:hypothetical protein